MSRNKEKETKETEEIKEEKEVKEESQQEAGEKTEAPAEEEKAPEKDKKDEEIAKLKDQLLRNMAEYDNYRKRTAKEKADLMPDITARIVGEFLPIMDNLERALETECSDENYKIGVKMIYDSFMSTLDKLGVEKVPTEDFDPAMHQAVQQVQSDEIESGKIASVFQNGYRIGTKVLRFAMVAVVA